LAALQSERKMLKEEVDDEDIAEVISRWTGIPVSRMLESEREKLVRMEERLGPARHRPGQAIQAVSNAVRRARSGSAGPQPAHRLVHLHGTHRRGQNRTGQGAGRVYLR
jgi:ATP-dependent Clp protease ATP-binding subunit ClpB